VPYNALGVTVESVIQMIQEMQRYFAPYGVTVHELPLSDCAEVLQKVKSFLPGHDMLVAIEYDAFAHQFLAGYIKLCEQAGITCFSATLSGVGDGAAITYATDTAPMGTVAARMIEQILFKGALPAVMSVVSLESFSTLFINPATSAWQGYVPDIEHIKVNLAKNTATAGVQERVRVVPIKGQE
ncbi:MAG: hypothetical protein QG632_819, partial [Candidatus Dependentiae bacterium]|nr:hypothetical protein [Candidatus Dependentiae bacterium]